MNDAPPNLPASPGLAGELEHELDNLIDQVLDLLERSAAVGVELDPLTAIIARLKERGTEMNLEELPPMMRMLMAGILG